MALSCRRKLDRRPIPAFSLPLSFNSIVCIDPMGFLPWDIRVALPGESQLRQSSATQPTVHAGKCFHNPPKSDMDYGIFNVRTDVNACGCTQGCTGTRKRVSTER